MIEHWRGKLISITVHNHKNHPLDSTIPTERARIQIRVRRLALVIMAVLLLSSCTAVSGVPTLTTAAPTLTPFQVQTHTPDPISTSESSSAQSLTPTVTDHPAGAITIPILLYHHIAESSTDHRYYVAPALFEQQMQWLVDHGYQAITEADLAEVIRHGGKLPEKPVIITFDDGNADFFTGAFPVMNRLNMVGVAFLVTDRIDLSGFVTSEQVKEMIKAGWEIGSHTVTHPDLLRQRTNLNREIVTSREWLNQKFGIDVVSFAYPFGLMNASVAKMVEESGYTSAAGLGGRMQQSASDLYDLSRTEIRGYFTMAQFEALMP